MQESKTRLEGLDRRIRLGGEIHSHMGRRLASDRPVNLRSFLPSCLPHCLAPPIEPPEPSSRASAAAHCLRRRSSSSTATNRNLPRIPASICASDMSQLSQISHESPAPNCKSCLFALPKPGVGPPLHIPSPTSRGLIRPPASRQAVAATQPTPPRDIRAE